MFVLAVDDPAEATKIAEHVRHNFPNVPILARCRNRTHYWELRASACKQVFRETFGSSYETGIAALRELGYRAFTAHASHERGAITRRSCSRSSATCGARSEATSRGRAASLDEAERLMRQEDPTRLADAMHGWDNESLRADRKVDEAAVAPTQIEPS